MKGSNSTAWIVISHHENKWTYLNYYQENKCTVAVVFRICLTHIISQINQIISTQDAAILCDIQTPAFASVWVCDKCDQRRGVSEAVPHVVGISSTVFGVRV